MDLPLQLGCSEESEETSGEPHEFQCHDECC